MRKLRLFCLGFGLLSSGIVNAQDTILPQKPLLANSQNVLQQQVKKDDGKDDGWDFYDDKEPLNKNAIKKNNELGIAQGNIIKLLMEIRDENKKQTHIQEQILDILKRRMDPQPKEIVVNGKKCIANSSSECFDYASLIENNPEVNKVPALKKFLSDPYTLANAAEYLKWQGQLFSHSYSIGNGLQFAQEQFGQEASSLPMARSTYNNTTGLYDGVMMPKIKKRYINSLRNELRFKIFIGENNKLDIFSLSSIAETLSGNERINFEFIFKNQYSKDLFESGIRTIYGKNNANWNRSIKIVDVKQFNDYGIYTTPSLVAIHSKGIGQTILTGRITDEQFVDRTLNFLEYNKLIDYSKMSDYENWDETSGDFVKDFYDRNYGVDILKDGR